MNARSLSILIALLVIITGIAIVKHGEIGTERDASWIVRRAQEQASLQSYSSMAQTRVSCQGEVVTGNVKIIRTQPNRGRIEYLSEPLKGVIVGNDGNTTWRYDPKTERLVISDNTNCTSDADKLRLLLENHRITLAGTDTVAGRQTYSLVVRPKDSGEIRKRLWIDKATSVVVRQEDYGTNGKLQSSTRFTSIQFEKRFPDKLFEAPSDVKTKVSNRMLGATMSPGKLSEAVEFTVRAPKYIPKGYKLDGYRLYACPCECPHQSAYIRYSNGLSSVSVFESKVGSGCRAEAGCGKSEGPMGTCEVKRADRDEIARLEKDGISFVVVADMDGRELRKIAESL